MLLQTLAVLSKHHPAIDLAPLLDCVRWSAMPADELIATAACLQQDTELSAAVQAAFAWRLLAVSNIGQAPAKSKRQAQQRCLQLLLDVATLGPDAYITGQRVALQCDEVEEVFLAVRLDVDEEQNELHLVAHDSKFPVGFDCVFMAINSDGLGMTITMPSVKTERFFCEASFLTDHLWEPLPRLGAPNSRVLLLAAIPPQP